MADRSKIRSKSKNASKQKMNKLIRTISMEIDEKSRIDTHPELLQKEIHRAAQLIRHAEALIITAGAGMGVDSGLPDIRDNDGLWRAYPPLKSLNIGPVTVSNPQNLERNPRLVWGFWGHRYNMYKETNPHEGYQILKKWGEQKEGRYFAYTSNVDGHFQKAGFPKNQIVECHGSIHRFQYMDRSISEEIWDVPDGFVFDVDERTLELKSPLPVVSRDADKLIYPIRPNVCMFHDYKWVGDVTDNQQMCFYNFHQKIVKDMDAKFVVIELGAGLGDPNIRYMSESLVTFNKGILIRINPVNFDVPDCIKEHVSLPMKALDALKIIDDIIVAMKF